MDYEIRYTDAEGRCNAYVVISANNLKDFTKELLKAMKEEGREIEDIDQIKKRCCPHVSTTFFLN